MFNDIGGVLKAILTEIKGMRTDLHTLNEGVKKVNENLEAIRDENHDRFELLHSEAAKKLPRGRHSHESRHR